MHGNSWRIVAALALMSAVVSGFSSGCLAVLLPHFRGTLELNPTQTASITTTYLMSVVLVAPLSGWLMDRFSPRVVVGGGCVLVIMGFVAAAQTHTFAALLGAYIAVGAGAGAAVTVAVSVIVASLVNVRAGLAMATVKAGATIGGGAIAPLLTTTLISHGGLRSAMVWIAFVIALGSAPVLGLLMRTRAPRRATPATPSPEGSPIRRKEFWRLVLSMACANMGATGFYFSIVLALLDKGFTSEWATRIYAASNLMHLAGLAILGALADRRGAQPALAASLAVSAVGMIVFLFAGTSATGWVAVGVFVILSSVMGVGMQELMPLVLKERYGVSGLGKLYGGAIGLTGVPVAMTPMLTGWLVETTGGYEVAFVCCTLLVLGGCVLLMSLRRPAPSQSGLSLA